MKYSLIITFCILIILLLGGSLVFYMSTMSPASEEPIVTDFSNINQGTQGVVESVPDTSESLNQADTRSLSDELEQRIFIDQEVVQDYSNPNDYVIYGEATECGGVADGCEIPFSITYNQVDDFFTVVLFQVPLASARSQAEALLINRYGLRTDTLCALSYQVNVPFWVSEEYAGVDLRFSGCPNAVQL